MSSSEELEDVKKDIRSTLIVYKGGCRFSEFKRAYRELVGQHLPFAKFGYSNDISFLYDMPDVVEVSKISRNEYHLTCIANKDTEHIQKLVSRQKPKKKSVARTTSSTYFWNPQVSSASHRAYDVPPRFQTNTSCKRALPQSLAVALPVKKPESSSKSHGASKTKEEFQSYDKAKLESSSKSCGAFKTNAEFQSYDKGFPFEMSTRRPVCELQSQMPKTSIQAESFSAFESDGSSCILSPRETLLAKDHFPDTDFFNCKKEQTMDYFSNDRFTPKDLKTSTPNGASALGPWEDLWRTKYSAKETQNVFDFKNTGAACLETFDSIYKETLKTQDDDDKTPGVSEKVKNNVRKVMEGFQHGIWAKDFPSSYEEVTSTPFDLHSLGYYDLASFVDALPDILARKSVTGSRKDWLILPLEALEKDDFGPNAPSPKTAALLIDSVILSTQKILQAYPEGVRIKDFLHIYSLNCQEPLYIADLGFDSIENFFISVADRVPLKFKFIEGCKSIHLAPSNAPFKLKKPLVSCHVQSLIPLPPGVSLVKEYTLQKLPKEFNLDHFFEVYVSTITDPGHLFLQIKGNDTSVAMLKIYDIMENLYHGIHSKRFVMNDAHILVGVMAVALWPNDNHWYRVKVLDVPNSNSVKVFYVDYGTIEVIPKTMLRYIRDDFISFPAQALRARLAYLRPPNNENTWSTQSRHRILALCKDNPLMVKVLEENEDGVLTVVLCDTHGSNDIYLNDILLREGLAGFEPLTLPPASEPFTPPRETTPPPNPLEALQVLMQACSLATGMNPEALAQAVQNLTQNVPAVSATFRNPTASALTNSTKGSSSTASSRTSPASNDSSDIFDDSANSFFDEFYEKVSNVTKRYVKRIRTSDGYVFHILIHGVEPCVSSGDISSLIWSNKESDYLLQRLQNREAPLETITLSEEDNQQMFEQFRRFHVKGCKKVNSKLCIMVYPLGSVIEILNMFGHPSAELRVKILSEKEAFDPLQPMWLELSEVEIPEKEEEESYTGTDDDKLNRLCLYDLQAMREGIRIRQLKLKGGAGDEEEKQKLGQLYERVVQRIAEINHICSNFSSDKQL